MNTSYTENDQMCAYKTATLKSFVCMTAAEMLGEGSCVNTFHGNWNRVLHIQSVIEEQTEIRVHEIGQEWGGKSKRKI